MCFSTDVSILLMDIRVINALREKIHLIISMEHSVMIGTALPFT